MCIYNAILIRGTSAGWRVPWLKHGYYKLWSLNRTTCFQRGWNKSFIHSCVAQLINALSSGNVTTMEFTALLYALCRFFAVLQTLNLDLPVSTYFPTGAWFFGFLTNWILTVSTSLNNYDSLLRFYLKQPSIDDLFVMMMAILKLFD